MDPTWWNAGPGEVSGDNDISAALADARDEACVECGQPLAVDDVGDRCETCLAADEDELSPCGYCGLPAGDCRCDAWEEELS